MKTMISLEDVRSEQELRAMIAIHARLVDTWQDKPWTGVKAKVRVLIPYRDQLDNNGEQFIVVTRKQAIFEAYGFCRQRQYTSFVIRKWKAVLAKGDEWSSQFGVDLAKKRAIHRLFVSVRKIWRRWPTLRTIHNETGIVDTQKESK